MVSFCGIQLAENWQVPSFSDTQRSGLKPSRGRVAGCSMQQRLLVALVSGEARAVSGR
jgi:hypothetical protein